MTQYSVPDSLPIIEPAIDKIASTGAANLASNINALQAATQRGLTSAAAQVAVSQAAQDATISNQSDIIENQGTRLASVEVLGGLAPGDVNDATAASLIANPETMTSSAFDTATKDIGDSRYLRVIAQPTAPPVQSGVMWVNTAKGTSHVATTLGDVPLTNLATNPSFESETQNATISTPLTFIAGSQNLRYTSLDTGTPGQNWVDRLPVLAASFTAAGLTIVGCQENDNAGIGTSQTAQLAASLGGSWVVADGSANNGILYRSDVFVPITSPVTTEINKVNLQAGTQRTMTHMVFRHIITGRRIIFAVAHFQVDGSSTANNASRTESAHIVGKLLMDLRASMGDKPVVVLTGDFNQSTTITDSPYAVLATYGLINTRTTATTVTNGTLNSYNGFDPAMTGRQSGEWVDGILATSDVTIPTMGLKVTYASGGVLPLATPLPSDHNMVAATVAISAIPAVRLQGGSGPVTSGGSSQTYRSAEWSVAGATSLCNDIANATSAATGSYPAGQAGALDRLGWVLGHTYTVSATLRLAAAQTGTLDTSARKITIGVTQGTTNFTFASSEQAPNAAGVYPLSVTFTIPAGATNAFIRLMNGSQLQKAWWDGLTITEGTTVVERFDGDTPGCSWLGSPHASRSLYPGPTWVPIN